MTNAPRCTDTIRPLLLSTRELHSPAVTMDHSHEATNGLPWLNSPVMLHSSRMDECTLTPEQCVYRKGHWRYWYEADHVYALGTIYFLCATVGVFAISHFAARYAPEHLRKNTLWRKGTAAGRFLAYRGVRVPGLGYWSGSLGVALLILVGVVFFFAMSLGPRPYYWPNTETVSYGGSPPIATRSGWMSIALLPFVLVLGTKANLISVLTGIAHEKLQVFHHWTSYAMFVLALVHTFPFIIYNISQGGIMEEWRTSMFYWTGVAALLPQAWLTCMSFSAIRNRYYEFFKSAHLIIALLFLLFLFFHCNFRLSSWDYSIAAASLYLASLATSLIRTHLINGWHTASISLPPSGLVRITIPTILSWNPGQHVFIRFQTPTLGLGWHTLTSHPFTISSTSYNLAERGKANEMVLYVKPKRGITGRLAKIASKSPGRGYTVLLEGPYGGIDTDVLARADCVVIVSGGSGGGFSLPVLESALRIFKESGNANKEIQVVFASHSVDMARWYRDEIETILGASMDRANNNNINISTSIHVTSTQNMESETDITVHSDPKSASEETQPIESTASETPPPSTEKEGDDGTFKTGRPNLPSIIADTAAEAEKRTAIFACGPASMLHDVRNAAADEQERILRRGAGEVYLHTESFSW
ncbi:ferric reductase NAD binding domain-containing protein [Aspergillus cavernicola]|uniref:Ferric reductase NAD binding domain-containing protein n=1 Tax=Aspergillus cavernicola TaxID=176166 RepID=A0ABR4IXG8_9EURO